MRIDLHTHSRASDGTDSPAGLVRAAADAGLDVLALTDHDTADGWDEATRAAAEVGLTLVPGMEISTRHRGRSVHLLAYYPDPEYPPLVAELDKVLTGRSARVPIMVDRLNGLGIDITEDDVHHAAHGAVASGRPHVADALVTLGVVPDRTAAFDRYLGWGRPAHVDRYAVPLDVALRLVAEAGGVSVVAHPWGRGGLGHPDGAAFAELKALGLTGIEVDHQDHDARARDRLRGIARDLDLVVTGSSDYHGDGKADHDLGCNTTAPEEFERLTSARGPGTSGARHPG